MEYNKDQYFDNEIVDLVGSKEVKLDEVPDPIQTVLSQSATISGRHLTEASKLTYRGRGIAKDVLSCLVKVMVIICLVKLSPSSYVATYHMCYVTSWIPFMTITAMHTLP